MIFQFRWLVQVFVEAVFNGAGFALGILLMAALVIGLVFLARDQAKGIAADWEWFVVDISRGRKPADVPPGDRNEESSWESGV